MWLFEGCNFYVGVDRWQIKTIGRITMVNIEIGCQKILKFMFYICTYGFTICYSVKIFMINSVFFFTEFFGGYSQLFDCQSCHVW